MGKSKILVLGATGYIGKYIAKASARLGHPTFAVVRPDTTAVPNAARKVLLDSFTAAGIKILDVSQSINGSCIHLFPL
jgi:uncharacterized protein YbjT (DUF2867 family)